MEEIRGIIRRMEATQQEIIELVTELARRQGVDISSVTGRTLG